MHRAFVFFVFIGFAISSAAENYVARTWLTENGLPQSSVNSIIQTRDKYLWVGTFSGLVRFDGTRFTTFNTIQTPQLGSDWITCLYEDRAGGLWIGTRSGLACWRNGKMTRIVSPAKLAEADISRIVEPEPGQFLISTVTGLFWLQGETGGEIEIPEPQWPTRQSWLVCSTDGAVWLGHRFSLFRIRDRKVQLQQRYSSGIHSLSGTRDGTLWIANEDGHLRQHSLNGATTSFHLPDTTVSSVFQATNGTIWLGTMHGIAQWNNGRLAKLNIAGGGPLDRIQTLMEDSEGVIWLGSDGGGLTRLEMNAVTTMTKADGLGFDDIATLWEDPSGDIWAGAFAGGLNFLSKATSTQNPDASAPRWKRVSYPDVLKPDATVSAITRDRLGRLWIGGYGSRSTRIIENQIETLPDVPEIPVRVFFEDKSGQMWVGTENGLYCLHGRDSKRFGTDTGLSHNAIRAIAGDQDGALWIGTEKGLNRLIDGRVQNFFVKDGLGKDFIQTLQLDKQGTLWIGTDGGGLTRFQNNRFSTVNTRHGLFHDTVSQIIEDDAGAFWIGSNAGIFRVSKQSVHDVMDGKARALICVAFGKNNGMRHLECAGGFQPSCLKSRDGNLWFSTVGGIVIIDPRKLTANHEPPTVHIERVVMDDQTISPLPGSLALPDSNKAQNPSEPEIIFISPGSHRLEFHYSGLHFTSPEQIQFKYQLQGYDTDWITVGTRRVAYYSHVPPGQYHFLVEAASNQGVWNATPARITIEIQPLFHQTLWFRSLITSSMVAGVLLFYRGRINAVRRMEHLRFRIAHDLHDEAGSNLASIRLLSHRASKKATSSEFPLPELSEIQRISQATAESIRSVVWLIDPRFDTLQQMLKGMENEIARFSSEILCDFQWNIDRLNRTLSVDFRTHFFLIFKEVLHNVQKHARAKHLKIRLDEINSFLVLSIQDDGVGFDQGAANVGHGLTSLKNRAEQLKADLRIESGVGRGTRVTLKVKSP